MVDQLMLLNDLLDCDIRANECTSCAIGAASCDAGAQSEVE
jgi:hypothetical protein